MNKILLITGSAPTVLKDMTDALIIADNAGFHPLNIDHMAIGLSSIDKYLCPIKYMATYHPAEIQQIKKRREEAGGNTDYLVISHERKPEVDIYEPFVPPTGSSSHLGALAAIRLGYTKIILCGCPLDDEKYKVFQAGWTAKLDIVKDKVRSMSGWTKELLGLPTEEWLNE